MQPTQPDTLDLMRTDAQRCIDILNAMLVSSSMDGADPEKERGVFLDVACFCFPYMTHGECRTALDSTPGWEYTKCMNPFPTTTAA